MALYARIKGVPENRRVIIIEDVLQQLTLTDERSKLASELSGGNQRKLSVAIAILGSPPVVLLDEPSAGMDPEARRFMWSMIERISQRDQKSAIVLTTHSMEEAEALSTKMGIMVKGGSLRCFGSSQHIKNKFATGFEIQLKIRRPDEKDLDQFKMNLGLHGNLTGQVHIKRTKPKVEQQILNQIRKDGIGSDLFLEGLANEGEVRMHALVGYCFNQVNCFNFIKHLCKSFEYVQMQEYCGNYYKLKVPKSSKKTIGHLFGLIESVKDEFNISEYGVCQTTLEEIFQTFAQQRIDDRVAFTFTASSNGSLELLNPDKKSIDEQLKRLSAAHRGSVSPKGPITPTDRRSLLSGGDRQSLIKAVSPKRSSHEGPLI